MGIWKALHTELEGEGVHILTYVNPAVVDVAGKPNAQRNLFQEAVAHGYWSTRRTATSI